MSWSKQGMANLRSSGGVQQQQQQRAGPMYGGYGMGPMVPPQLRAQYAMMAADPSQQQPLPTAEEMYYDPSAAMYLGGSGGKMGMHTSAPQQIPSAAAAAAYYGGGVSTFAGSPTMMMDHYMTPPLPQQLPFQQQQQMADASALPFGAEDFPALPGSTPSSTTQQPQQQHSGSPTQQMTSALDVANAPTFVPKQGLVMSPTKGQQQQQQQQQYVSAYHHHNNPSPQPYLTTSVPQQRITQQQQQQAQVQQLLLQQQQQQQALLQQQQQQQQMKMEVSDRFGMPGLLDVIRMTNTDLNMLALGTDLTALGLNLTSSTPLYPGFSSSSVKDAIASSKAEPDYRLPVCYLSQTQPKPLTEEKMTQMSDQTLMYIFFTMPKDQMQLMAAKTLCKREWVFHRELRAWIKRVKGRELSYKDDTHECGSFVCFDVHEWEFVQRDDMVVFYSDLERL